MDLLILGASARSAAQSALRAGFRPITIDLFADRDLAALATAHRIESDDYPAGFAALAERLPPCPWIYTGALENHPEAIDRIAAKRPLWGISGTNLRSIRDPVALQDALRRHGLPTLSVRLDPAGLPRDGSWLVKPLASAGGRRIFPLRETTVTARFSCYFQERIETEGQNYSLLAVGCKDGITPLGMTEQRIGTPDAPFLYRGSLGPIPPSLAVRDPGQIVQIGRVLWQEFGLRGLFGVDFVVKDGQPFVVEVNPRYTASVEVLELGLGRSLLGEHARAFDRAENRGEQQRSRPPRFVGKEVLFADRRCRLPAIDSRNPRAGASFAVSPVADLPAPGSIFEPGEPILTVLSRGSSLGSCRDRLERRCHRWKSRLVAIDT